MLPKKTVIRGCDELRKGGWDDVAQATPNGQLVFFAALLRTTGIFGEWVHACPLEYRSGNAPGQRDVLGTLELAIQLNRPPPCSSQYAKPNAAQACAAYVKRKRRAVDTFASGRK